MSKSDLSSAPRPPDGTPRMSRRALLAGVGVLSFTPALKLLHTPTPTSRVPDVAAVPAAAPVSAVTGAEVQTLHGLAVSGTSQVLRPPAGLPLLLDPNRANVLSVTLPLAAQGSVASSTMLPVAEAGMTGRVWARVVQFQQPYVGEAVNPRLKGIAGTQPVWGSGGPGSVDEVTLISTDGRTWSIGSSAILPRSGRHSVLETASPAPAASVNPMALPVPILLWSAADMYGSVANGAKFGPGGHVGQDLSGSGNDLVVNAGETVTYQSAGLPGAGGVPRGLPPFPFISATSARAGVGCTFAGGPVTAWTIVVSFVPSDTARSRVFDEQPVLRTRAVKGGNTVGLALKYGNMGYTWDGSSFNNLSWRRPTFARGGTPVPTVMAWSSTGGSKTAAPSLLAGSLEAPLAACEPGNTHTVSPAAIGGIDLPNSYGIAGLAVYATALTPSQMKAAALRLGYVGFGEES